MPKQYVRETLKLNQSSLVREGSDRGVARRCTNWKFSSIVEDATAKRYEPFSTQLELAAVKVRIVREPNDSIGRVGGFLFLILDNLRELGSLIAQR